MKKLLAYLSTAVFALSLIAPIAVSAQTVSSSNSNKAPTSIQRHVAHRIRKAKAHRRTAKSRVRTTKKFHPAKRVRKSVRRVRRVRRVTRARRSRHTKKVPAPAKQT